MALEIADFVLQNANAPGTAASVQLLTTPTGRRTWLSAFSTGAAVRYVMDDGTQAEGGRGTLTAGSPDTLSRDTVKWNTAGTTSRLDFTGAVRVYCALAAEDMIFLDSNGQVGPLALKGRADGSDAATGVVGEYLSSAVPPGSAVSLVTNTSTNVTSLPLPAGDWEVSGQVGFSFGGGTTTTFIEAGISGISGGQPQANNGPISLIQASFYAGAAQVLPLMPWRFSSASAQTAYLLATAGFAGTGSAYGFLRARRV